MELQIGNRITNPYSSTTNSIFKYIRIKTAQNLTVNTSIANVNSLSIYPNPTTGNCYMSLPGVNETYQVLVHDMLGKIISKENVLPTNSHLINLENCNKGIYFVNINNSNYNTTLKVSKQ